jgi:hypothetical protein
MVQNQFARLQQDLTELESFAQAVSKEGNHDLYRKIVNKKRFLETYLEGKKIGAKAA